MYRIIFCIGGFLVFYLMVDVRNVRAQEAKPFAYEDLPELVIGIDTKIEEQQDYMPGRLKDLVLMSDGTLLVSDLQKSTIEQFRPEGGHVGTIARGGEGPGELPFYYSLVDGANDTLLVWHPKNHRLDYFAQGSSGRYAHVKAVAPHQFTGRRLQLLGTQAPSRYYALTGQPDAALIQRDMPDYRQSPVAIVDDSLQVVRDSIHMLKMPNNIFGDPREYGSTITMNGLAYLGMPPYRYQDRLLPASGGRYIIARPDSSALFVYGPDHMLKKRIFLNLKKRSVQPSDLDEVFMNHEMAVDSRIRGELEKHVSANKPPFMNVWVSKKFIWLHTDTEHDEKRMMVFTRLGKPVGTFSLPGVDAIKCIRENRIYTIHKDPTSGHSIRIYDVGL